MLSFMVARSWKMIRADERTHRRLKRIAKREKLTIGELLERFARDYDLESRRRRAAQVGEQVL